MCGSYTLNVTTKYIKTVLHKWSYNKPSRPKHKQGTPCHPTPRQRVSASLMRSFLPPSPSRRMPPTPTTFNERETPGTVGQVRVGGTHQVLSLEWTLNRSRLPQGPVRNPPPTSSNVSGPACSLRNKKEETLAVCSLSSNWLAGLQMSNSLPVSLDTVSTGSWIDSYEFSI